MGIFKAELLAKKNLAGNFYYLALGLVEPPTITFTAGQFVMVTVDEKNNLRRPYSIASPPFVNDKIKLLVNVSPGGPGSSWALSCRPGDEVSLLGPFGKFTVRDGGKNNLAFIAAGAGIAPIKAMIDQLAEEKDQRLAELWWGLRSQGDVFWQNHFEGLAKRQENFRFKLTLSRPKNGWRGLSGRVTHQLEKLPPGEFAGKDFYICGSPAMVEDVREILLKKGVLETNIFHERF